LGGRRGRLISVGERERAVVLIDEAVSDGAGRLKACEAVGISSRTYFRWKKDPAGDRRKGANKEIPRKLTDEEQQEILDICCSAEYRDNTPYEIYYTLLEEERRYVASIRTMYRVLKAHNKVHHRGNTRPRKGSRRPPEVVASGPNQVWCWDITWLATRIKGQYFYAYKIIDIWDKSIVGWEIHDREDESLARELFRRLHTEHNIEGIHLHSDNGHPMKGMSLLALLYSLHISVSRSRPRVSNDNPFIEAYFKTMKYCVQYPGHFATLAHARSWMAEFVNWYNTEHRHSSLGFVTPQQMRTGAYRYRFAQRNAVLKAAYKNNPSRWSRAPKQWVCDHTVYLNPSVATQQNILNRKMIA